jgi:hypothetical protein
MKRYWFAVLLLSCFLQGCGGTDYNYVDTNEEKPGPGLFSGEDGVFTVVKMGTKTEEEENEPAEKTVDQQ